MNGDNTPVTRAELQAELQQELAALESRLESRIIGRMRDMETALLTAFHSYATGVSVRFRKIEADVSNIDTAATARLAALEDRVLEVERRLPPVI
jgi:flagellar biosynthesis/type III secretory pathway protein FliH